MTELKSCPFCGMFASTWSEKCPNGKTYYEPFVEHEEGCVLNHAHWCMDYGTEEELISAWNRRAGENG